MYQLLAESRITAMVIITEEIGVPAPGLNHFLWLVQKNCLYRLCVESLLFVISTEKIEELCTDIKISNHD